MKPILARLRRSQKHHRKFYFLLLLILSAILFFPVFYQIRHSEFRSLGLLGVFLLNLLGSATIFFPTPAFLSVGISATKINPLLVALVASAGGALGEGTTFLFGYTSNKAFNLEKRKMLKKFKEKVFDRYGWAAIFVLALVPNPFFDGIGMVAGISKYPIKKFLFLTFSGRFFRYLVLGYVTHYLAFR